MYDLYTGLLRMLDEFRDDGKEVEMVYQMDTELEILKEQYQLHEIIGTGSDLSKIIALLKWESAHIFHKGNYDNHVKNTAMDLFNYAFDNGEENGINCRSLSIALTECYLSVGIKARTIYLMPFSPFDGDNHVVCEAWSKELKKWIMVDPTYCVYLMDESKIPLNVMEIRRKLALQEKLIFSDGYHYNGSNVEEKEIIEYYAKDFFYFQLRNIHGYNSENKENNLFLTIAPKGYDVLKSTLANIDYRIKKWGDGEKMQLWRKNAMNDFIIYKDTRILK